MMKTLKVFYNEVVKQTTNVVAFFEFVDSPKDFPEILKLFDKDMQEKLLLYSEAQEYVNSISIFDSEKLENMS